MASDKLSTVWAPRTLSVLSVLRIFTGLALLQHGTAKILGFPFMPNFANVHILSLTGVSGLIELIGGVLFTIGLFTRPVAFILSGFTAAAVFHRPCRQGILSGAEWRRTRGTLSFCLPLFRLRGRRSMGPGRDQGTQVTLLAVRCDGTR